MNQRTDTTERKPVDSAEAMIAEIRRFGIIPFFSCAVPGWSIEELTTPECWFYENGSDGVLGPWDWKIDAVRTGEIAYGKFLGGKAAFATREWYLELMNWRRSLPRYRLVLNGPKSDSPEGSFLNMDWEYVSELKGKPFKCKTNGDKLMRILSPTALSAICDAGSIEAKAIRLACSRTITPSQVRSMGKNYRPLLTPAIKKNIIDSVMQFLQMGTWSLIGDFERVYRGPDLTYSGWQRSSNTTPEAFFGLESADSSYSESAPFWAKIVDGDSSETCQHDDGGKTGPEGRTPEQSRERIISHISSFFPMADRSAIEKLV